MKNPIETRPEQMQEPEIWMESVDEAIKATQSELAEDHSWFLTEGDLQSHLYINLLKCKGKNTYQVHSEIGII